MRFSAVPSELPLALWRKRETPLGKPPLGRANLEKDRPVAQISRGSQVLVFGSIYQVMLVPIFEPQSPSSALKPTLNREARVPDAQLGSREEAGDEKTSPSASRVAVVKTVLGSHFGW